MTETDCFWVVYKTRHLKTSPLEKREHSLPFSDISETKPTDQEKDQQIN